MSGYNPLHGLGQDMSGSPYDDATGFEPMSTEGPTAPHVALMLAVAVGFLALLKVAGFRAMIAIGRG